LTASSEFSFLIAVENSTSKRYKFRGGLHEHFEALARRCARFAQDNAQIILAARPEIPEELNDRAADNWEPLLAIPRGGRLLLCARFLNAFRTQDRTSCGLLGV